MATAQLAVAEGPQRPPLTSQITKKLKYFLIFCFFSGARVYTLGAGVALCYIYIYNVYIYIFYIFWLGLFLIQLYETVASPIPKRCPISVLENEKEVGGMSSRAPGLRNAVVAPRERSHSLSKRYGCPGYPCEQRRGDAQVRPPPPGNLAL